MNPVRIIRYLKNYVLFSAKGGFIERFLNLCRSENVLIFDIGFNQKGIEGKVLIKDFQSLEDIALRSGVTLKKEGEKGIRFFLRDNMHKAGIPVAALIYIVFTSFMSLFVWTTEVTGNTNLAAEDILLAAEKRGLFCGTFRPTFDEIEAANRLASDFGEKISWAAINIKGSKAVVEIREKTPSIKPECNSTPANIVADFDGVILSVEQKNGVVAVKEGSAVKKGDLLISGVFEKDDLSAGFTRASGTITALHKKQLRLDSYKNKEVSLIKSVKKIPTPLFFFLKMPFSSSENLKEIYTHEKFAAYNGVRLPVGLTVISKFETEKAVRNEKMLFLSLCESITSLIYEENKNTTVLSQQYNIFSNKSRLSVEFSFEAIDFMGEIREISINN